MFFLSDIFIKCKFIFYVESVRHKTMERKNMNLLGSISSDLDLTKRVILSDVRLNDLNFYNYQDSVVEGLKNQS